MPEIVKIALSVYAPTSAARQECRVDYSIMRDGEIVPTRSGDFAGQVVISLDDTEEALSSLWSRALESIARHELIRPEDAQDAQEIQEAKAKLREIEALLLRGDAPASLRRALAEIEVPREPDPARRK